MPAAAARRPGEGGDAGVVEARPPAAPTPPPIAAPTAAPGAQPMGIVATHPIAAPVAAPLRPPCVVLATGLGLHAARLERPETSTSAPITFITTSYSSLMADVGRA